MLTLSLPSRPNRQLLRSFWLAISVISGLVGAGAAWLAGLDAWVLVGLGVIFVLVTPGMARPRAVSLPYRIWNSLAQGYARTTRLFLMGICFYTVFLAVGRTRSGLWLRQPDPTTSTWLPRAVFPASSYGARSTSQGDARHGWLRGLFSWSIRSKNNAWAISLAPFLVLYRMLDFEEAESEAPSDIYTLY